MDEDIAFGEQLRGAYGVAVLLGLLDQVGEPGLVLRLGGLVENRIRAGADELRPDQGRQPAASVTESAFARVVMRWLTGIDVC